MLPLASLLLLNTGCVYANSFSSPSTGIKWRYWVQDAGVDSEVVQSDIAEMARTGATGFEWISYQSYGPLIPGTGISVLDPTDFAIGSDLFSDATSNAIQAAIDNNLTIDFPLGPNQAAGVPVLDVDTEGMNTELVFGSHFINSGETFNGSLPEPNIIPVFSSTTGDIANANITKRELVGVIGAQLVNGAGSNDTRVSLDFASFVDLTQQVQTIDNSSTLSWSPLANRTSVVIAYYSRRNGYPEAQAGFGGVNAEEPGSWGAWAVDHFSAKGAEISTNFMDSNILSRNGIRDLLAQPGVGQYMWEDSMEMAAQLFWTEGFAERFLERHGYEVNVTLPVLHTLSFAVLIGTVPNQTFDFGSTVNWRKFTDDYQDTLTSLYMDYMSTFLQWSHSIGLSYSNQPAYNFPLDPAASATIPDAPEIESLGIPTIDEARQVSAGAHLANHSFFSSECGAAFNGSMSLTMNELLLAAKTQYASGVNTLVLHGFPYTGEYPNTTWPGYTTFGYLFADMHGPRQPAWDHYTEYLGYLARNQYVLQKGITKVDLAIYRKGYNVVVPPPFASGALTAAGYTYEYVSPENLKLPGVSVSNGRLASEGPAYKAFILNRQANITVDAAQTLVEYAQSGLPVIVLGEAPYDIPGYETGSEKKTQVQSLMSSLLAESSVRQVDAEENVLSALEALDVVPAAVAEPAVPTLFSVVRHEDDSASGTTVAYYYLFNQAPTTTASFTLTLNSGFDGTPFALDPWTGEVSPVLLYSSGAQGNILIPLVNLAANGTALFAVTTAKSFEDISAPTVHVTSVDSGVFAVVPAATNGSSDVAVELRSTEEGSKQVTLSDGRTMSAQFSLGTEARNLDGWVLNITSWTPPQNLTTVESVLIPLPSVNLTNGLVPWSQLDGLANVSGVGTYITSFDWTPAEQGGVGLMIDFGMVVHTMKAWLNGEQIAAVDPSNPVVDLSALVKSESNTIRVDVASTLLNAVNAVPAVQTLGQLRVQTTAILPNQEYGLISPVRLVPYARTTLSL